MNIGLIFDMDGVIIDNNHYHFQSWKFLAKKYGINIDEEYYRNHMNGRTFLGIMRTVFDPHISLEEAKRRSMEKEHIYRELYRQHLAPTNGLLDFLESGKNKKIPMVVGTSAPEENVKFILDGLNIRSYFKAVLDERSITNGKPDPEIYLKCAHAIKRKNNQCVVFEDAVAGIQAGKAAGSKVIALETSHQKKELDAKLIIEDFTQIDIEAVDAFLNEK